MTDAATIPVSDTWARKSWIDNQTYLLEYERSLKDAV